MKNVCNIIVVSLILAINLVAIGAEERKLHNFRDIYNMTNELESVGMLATNDDAKFIAQREKFLAEFAREPNAAFYLIAKHYWKLSELIEEFKFKAHQYIEECQKQNKRSLFTKIKLIHGGALGSLKSLSKRDGYLISLIEHYEQLEKTGQLNDELVARDMAKFRLHYLDQIMFISATYIKHLAIEIVQILNNILYQQARADDSKSENFLFEVHRLTKERKKLLLNYYSALVSEGQVKISETIDRPSEPIGPNVDRLKYSCHSIQYYQSEWTQNLPKCGDECSSSTNKYEDVVNFCGQFLDAK